GGGVNDGGFVPSAWDQRADLLPLEGEVRRDGKWRREEVEATGRREPEAEARGGGPDLGQPGAERRALKKLGGQPAGLRAAASYVMIAYQTSERHACRLMGLARSTQRYRRRRPERDAALRARLKKLAGKRMRFGYRRLTAVRVREGTLVNHKRVYRLYREEGLAMRIRERRRIRWNGRAASPAAERPNQRWSIDFVSDCVSTGKVIRMLTMVDDCTRECPAIEVDTSLGGLRVRQVLDRVAEERGLPEAIVLEPLSFSDSISSSWPARTFFHSGCDSNIGSGGCAR